MEEKIAHEHITTYRPAFDKRSEDPKKNYGINAMEMRFAVKGPEGAVEWTMTTGWHLPEVQDELEKKTFFSDYNPFRPKSWNICYHSRKPHFEGQEVNEKCFFMDGGKCYSDGSFLNGDRLLPIFLSKGIDALWEELEKCYDNHLLSDG